MYLVFSVVVFWHAPGELAAGMGLYCRLAVRSERNDVELRKCLFREIRDKISPTLVEGILLYGGLVSVLVLSWCRWAAAARIRRIRRQDSLVKM